MLKRVGRMALFVVALLGFTAIGNAQTLTKPTTPSDRSCQCYHLSRVVQNDWGAHNMKDFHLVAPPGLKIVVRTDDPSCWKAERVFFTRARLVDDSTGQVENSNVAAGEVATHSSLAGTQQTSPATGTQVPSSSNEVAVDSISWADATGESNPPPNPTDAEAQGGGGLNLPNPPAGKHYDFVHTFLGWRFCYPGRSEAGAGPMQRLSWYVTKSGGRTTPKSPKNSPVLTGELTRSNGTVRAGKNNDSPDPPTGDPGPPVTPRPNPDPPDPPDTPGFTEPTPPADPTGEPSGGLLKVALDPDSVNPDPLPSGVLASFDLSGYEGFDYEVVVSTALDASNDLGVDPAATPPGSWNVALSGAAGSFAAGPHADPDSATMTLQHTGGAPPGSKLYLVLVLHDPSSACEDMWSGVVTVNLP